ncbi:MAG TPA: class I SAM-dependent methyltransferase [Actinomycetota bacterium]|nr:class I SAM-dependent methyltransferase [Actinomycetota bacterium]
MTEIFRNTVIAEHYARHRDNHDDDFIDQLADQLGRRGSLIDIGAGAGAPAAALARRGIEVTAVEPSAAMIVQGRRRHPQLGFVRACGEELPLATDSADAALLMYVLHHADDPIAVLAEAGRVVRPGGRIIVVSGSPDSERQGLFRRYFPTLLPDPPAADEIWWWGLEADLELGGCRTAVHHVYPNRVLDEDYLRMVECEMFAPLRLLDPDAFDDGLQMMRAELGRPLPPPEVNVLELHPTGERPFGLEPGSSRSALLI